MSTERAVSGAKTRIRDKLIPGTLEHAHQVPYYRELWAGLPVAEAATTAALADFPLTGKYEPAGGMAAVRHPDRTPSVLMHSSGTTGHPFTRYRCAEEVQALADLLANLNARARERTDETRPIVHLSTISKRHHGNSIGALAVERSVTLGLLSARDLDKALGLLRRPRLFPDLDDPLVQLSGTPDDLVVLAHAVTEAGLADRLRPRTVTALADYLTDGHRDFLAATFPGARIVHRYSLSEVAGGATRCARCELFHFDVHVVPQVVSLDGRHPVTSGVGRLVLTELHPFSQYQPFIRYDTGDVVEAAESPCEPGEVSVALLGRQAHTALVEHQGRQVLAFRPIPLREALEGFPELARGVMHASIAPYDALPGSAPLASVKFRPGNEGARPRVELTCVTAFAPHLFPELTGQLSSRVREAVLDSSPELRAMTADGTCELHLELTGDRRAAAPFTVRGH
ncbi:hypothetical protein [Streptomyces sp. BPTC-684]|uniref:hypothetical protein n=1 Tax=Streptomyces sp. BPTC-684 TaxID=3043734 RepID=UPI0024B170A1|nr:hypothetical protein [Streptomyces sp. BPTC-684]WHM37871.1 hypothetical protein QIY60_13785 [Streptomyces sp. BPTC-684]